MKNIAVVFVAALCLLFSACHRPVAYFQRTPRQAVSRLPIEQPTTQPDVTTADTITDDATLPDAISPEPIQAPVASRENIPVQTTNARVQQRIHRIQSLLEKSDVLQPRPKPKPKSQLRLGNRIRQGLGLPLREELNWWQRISWKLKASIIILLVAVLFAILHITILAIIFGIVGAFLMISGLKKSFKVKRPWF